MLGGSCALPLCPSMNPSILWAPPSRFFAQLRASVYKLEDRRLPDDALERYKTRFGLFGSPAQRTRDASGADQQKLFVPVSLLVYYYPASAA